MKLYNSHITYCTNIHGGESWDEHFEQLKQHVPSIKSNISPHEPFGLGLRLSAQASREINTPEKLALFKEWLQAEDIYVFTMNGFPYGDFHLKAVKDRVHFPDWTTQERLDYTRGMFDVLAQLAPKNMECGISTSPLSYRFWFTEGSKEWGQMRRTATQHIIAIAAYLYNKEQVTGIYMHLDIEPEPDGVIENTDEFISWYADELLDQAYTYFANTELTKDEITALIKRYICLCYDVCHFALEYEDHAQVLKRLEQYSIKIGKFQISSALKIDLSENMEDRLEKKEVLAQFDEPIYLHQVIAKSCNGNLIKYRDLAEALPDIINPDHIEWRSHFHVPIFLENYGDISSTQKDILEIVGLQCKQRHSNHIEIETYTWAVLPKDLQVPIETSISRELGWLLDQIKRNHE